MIFIIPFIAALIGWVTNKLAVWMLFNPKQKTKIAFIEFQGLIPKNKARIAENFADIVSKELVDIDSIISDNAWDIHEILMSNIDKKLIEYINKMLDGSNGLGTAKRIFLNAVKEVVLREIESNLPSFIDGFKKDLTTLFDIKKIVSEKITKYTDDQLEQMFLTLARKEFKMIEYTGLILGFIIGCVQSGLMLLNLI